MQPILFRIPLPGGGQIPIFAYGFMIMLGFICSILYGAWRAKKEGEDPNHVLDIGLYAVVSGILGSRIFYYIEFYNEHFSDQPIWKMFAIWEGGIVFYGGLLAATAVILVYLRLKRLPVMKMADILATTIPLGLSFGRLGCYLNGCCWGRPDVHDAALLAVQFPAGSPAWHSHVDRVPALISQTASWSYPVHCTQLYEWLGAWILVGLLFLYYRWHARHGQVFAMLFILYGPVRWIIESYREHHTAERMIGWTVFWDPLAQAYMTKSQVVAIATLAAGLAIWAWFTLRGESYKPRS